MFDPQLWNFETWQRRILNAMTLCPPKGLLITFYLHDWPLPFSASSPSVHFLRLGAMERQGPEVPRKQKKWVEQTGTVRNRSPLWDDKHTWLDLVVDAVSKLPIKIPCQDSLRQDLVFLLVRGQLDIDRFCCFPTPQCANMQWTLIDVHLFCACKGRSWIVVCSPLYTFVKNQFNILLNCATRQGSCSCFVQSVGYANVARSVRKIHRLMGWEIAWRSLKSRFYIPIGGAWKEMSWSDLALENHESGCGSFFHVDPLIFLTCFSKTLHMPIASNISMSNTQPAPKQVHLPKQVIPTRLSLIALCAAEDRGVAGEAWVTNIPWYGCFLKWWYPQNTPKWSFLVGKPMVVGYHHFRKPPYSGFAIQLLKSFRFLSQTFCYRFCRQMQSTLTPKTTQSYCRGTCLRPLGPLSRLLLLDRSGCFSLTCRHKSPIQKWESTLIVFSPVSNT